MIKDIIIPVQELTTDHVRERFWKAARALATRKENRQKRVEMAASMLQPFGTHDTAQLPEDLRAEFDRLRQLYTQKVTPYNAGKWAEEIFDFYVKSRGGI
jgi:hypothetical protein